jgi:phosphatidylglycerophosphate synthase
VGRSAPAVAPATGGRDQPSLLSASRKRTLAPEYVCDYVFRPLAHVVVLALLPLRVPPPAVLLVATATGLSAAYAVGDGHLVAAALLLQVKTVLDNADGQLARASGRVSVLGRYLDSESDLLVNAALFAGLGYLTGRYVLAAVSFLALTLVLSVDFNLSILYRREHDEDVDAMPPANGLAHVLERIYGVVYAPHDRLVAAFVESRLERLGADADARLAYHDRATLTVLANFGLSTQLAALGVCLLLGRASAYFWLVLACGAVLVALAARRERLARTLPVFPEAARSQRRNG